MTDFDELKQTKAQCLADITEALPDYVNRLNSIDTRLLTYIDDAISGNASHANLMELAMPATPTSWSCSASARKCD